MFGHSPSEPGCELVTGKPGAVPSFDAIAAGAGGRVPAASGAVQLDRQ